MTTSDFKTIFIDEPWLTFGDSKRYTDPKKGLLAYGPCLYENRRVISSAIRLGIVGSRETINLAQQWIEKLEGEIPGKKEDDLLFQSFPGFTKIFGCRLHVQKECIEVVTEDEIKEVVMIKGFQQGVKKAADLFVEKLSNFRRGREPRPHVVICAFPQEIVDKCATKKGGYYETRIRLTAAEKEILSKIHENRRIGQTTLFPVKEEDFEMALESSNLRRIIKAAAMQMYLPTQLAKPHTFSLTSDDDGLQDAATRAWNFSVAICYKAEGYPWKLADMQTGTCYVGVAFYKDPPDSRGNMKSSMAQVFTHTGEGLVLRGSRAIVDEVTKSPHLSENGAYQLTTDALEQYKRQMHQLPMRLVVHKTSRFKLDELNGFKRASQGIKLRDFVTILERGIHFMRRRGAYPPVRGTVIQMGTSDYVLFTKGWIPYFETYPGLSPYANRNR